MRKPPVGFCDISLLSLVGVLKLQMFSWLSADTPGLDLGKDWEMPGGGLPWRCHCCEFMTYVTDVSCVENLLILGINNLADSVEELKGKESILFLLNDWTSFGYLENKHQWSQSLPVRTTQAKPFKEADDSVSTHLKGFSNSSVVKNLPASAGDAGLILGSWRSLEKEMTTHSSILAWEIPWTEEPGGL